MNSSPVLNLDLERTSLALWNEFLKSYFNGAPHDVGRDKGIKFPAAEIKFQENPQPQPNTKQLGITVVFLAGTRPKHYRERVPVVAGAGGVSGGEGGNLEIGEGGDGQSTETPAMETQMRAYADTSWVFFIRGADQGQVTTGADRLFGLLDNAMAVLPLAYKGIHRIRPAMPRLLYPGEGSPGQDLGYKLRAMTCRAQLRWVVRSQPAFV